MGVEKETDRRERCAFDVCAIVDADKSVPWRFEPISAWQQREGLSWIFVTVKP